MTLRDTIAFCNISELLRQVLNSEIFSIVIDEQRIDSFTSDVKLEIFFQISFNTDYMVQ